MELNKKRGVIMGVANNWSIAWSIAQACHEAGAEIILTYQNEVVEKRVKPLANKINASTIMCNVLEEGSVERAFTEIGEKWDSIDFVVHSIAFADKNELKGRYVDSSLQNFQTAMHASCFSFTEIAKHSSAIMHNGGSLITLSYYGAEKVVPNYNVMGVAKAALEASVRYLAVDLGGRRIRVNSISAGPVKTLASSGISDFRSVLGYTENNAPLKNNITGDDVGNMALFLVSDLSKNITGGNIYVDAGMNIIGMPAAASSD